MDISAREFDDELRRQQDQLRQLFGGNFDPTQFDTPESRRALLDGLINQRLVASAAVKYNLTVTDESLADTIHSIPAFKGADGNFSKSTYETVLRQQNPPLTPGQFEARLRYELSLGQLSRAVGESAIPSRTVADRLAAIEAQQREISEFRIAAEQFLPKVKIDEARVKAYYDANQAQFEVPERVKAEYVMLSSEAIAAEEKVAPEEVRKQWESTVGPRMGEKEAARKKAQEIAAAVRKNPASFAEVAKQESQDPGSKDNGGDLGFAPRGSFVKPYEDALYRLKDGQISEVVESEFGFHIIRLTGVQQKDGKEERRSSHILIPAPGDVKPFEQMRDQIEADLKKQRATRRFGESADAFQNMVYEQSDSLKPAAEKFKLKIQTTGWITRAPGQELGALDNPKLIAALFSSDAVRNKRNTDAIEVAPGTLVSARVVEHQPATQRKFEEVNNDIAALLQRQEAGGSRARKAQPSSSSCARAPTPASSGARRRPSRGAKRRACRARCCGQSCRPTSPSYPPTLACRWAMPATCWCASPRSSTPTQRSPRRAIRRSAPPGSSAQRSTKLMSRACAPQADVEVNQTNLERSSRKSGSKKTRFLFADAGDDVAEAGVDVEDLAGDCRGEVGQQERRDVADFLGRHVAPQRRVLLDELQDLAEARDARGGEGLDRARRDAVHADALRPEARGEIAHRRFQARLGQTHGVVVGHHALGAEIGQRHERGVAPLHHAAAPPWRAHRSCKTEMSCAWANAARENPSRKLPAIASRGAKAIACTRPSRPSQCRFSSWKSDAISASLVTSQGSASFEPSSPAISVTRSLKRSF